MYAVASFIMHGFYFYVSKCNDVFHLFLVDNRKNNMYPLDRLKRDSTKLNSADMLALLEFLEASQRNKHYGNEDLNSLEYQKPYTGPFRGDFAAASNINNGDDGDDDGFDDGINDGEWWNGEWIEPSVQYYGGVRNHFNDENTRKRLTTLPGK